MQFLIDRLPETADAFVQMSACERCIEIHLQRAIANGAIKDEIA